MIIRLAIFTGLLLFGSVACAPQDTYKMRYPQQDISFGTSVPYHFSESEKYSTDHQDRVPVNSSTPAEKPPLKRKPIKETLEWLGDENPDGSIAKVPRKQP